MKYKYLITGTLLAGLSLFNSCIDDFSELNSNPSSINIPDVRFLFTQCELKFQPADYWQFYGGFTNISAWAQTSVMSGGNTSRMNLGGGGSGYQVNEVLKYANEVRYQISLLSSEDKAKQEYIQYLCNPLLVYLGMEDTDMVGSRQYSEAEMIRYGGTLTPKYDTQEELFALWLAQLNETVTYLNTHKDVKDVLGSQDIIYKGDLAKWAKFANSLKLKLASRLIHTDKARAIQIVNEAVQNPAGLVSTLEDDFIMNKGKESASFGDDVAMFLNAGNERWINFMKKNKDTRLFYFFTKNTYNSNVIQGFFDQKREKYIPSYIMENVEYKEVDGKKTFTGWKAPGEPWVRYYGLPCQNDINKIEEYKEYFDPNGEAFHLFAKSGTKVTYTPTVMWNKYTIRGKYKYTYPDAPDVPPVETKDYPYYGLYFSAAEVNLLLAEFKLLGANLPQTAQQYFTQGVELSVRAYNGIAAKNHLPYYDSTYGNDKFDKTINTTEEMIADMLSCDVYKLNGSAIEDLEKVYIQQMLHYTLFPMDQFTTCRRSGVPMNNSTILPREKFDPALGDQYVIPRRFAVGEPDKTDKLYYLTIEAYKQQGFTYSGELAGAPATLAKERIWYDKGAPEYGAGPLVK